MKYTAGVFGNSRMPSACEAKALPLPSLFAGMSLPMLNLLELKGVLETDLLFTPRAVSFEDLIVDICHSIEVLF